MHEKNEIDMWLGKINKRQLDNNFNYKKKDVYYFETTKNVEGG